MTPLIGLTDAEARDRRARGLGNVVELRSSRSYVEIIRENVFTFINNIMFGLGIALVVLGRVSDAVVSVGVVMLNVVVSVVQEIRAKRTLDRIALLTRPKATVVRDGQEVALDPAEIVVGDILVARPGDQIVVDGAVVGDGRMDVDESLLTGESDRIPKAAGDPVYSGSFCVAGSAHYEATRVGAECVANQLTAGARAFRRILTPLQREIYLVIRVLILLVVYFELMLILSAFVQDLPVIQSVKMSVVIAGLVPNGLFLAIAVGYAIGAVRILGQGALVQQANAVESLSNVDVLCLDKTGTLTANSIALAEIAPIGIAEDRLRAILADFATSTPTPNRTSAAIAEALPGRGRRVVEEVPFNSARKWSALRFDDPDLSGLFVLGAPEILAPHLRPDTPVDPRAAAWAESGRRVVLFAHHPKAEITTDAVGDPVLPGELTPLGVIAFDDELRPEARETLAAFADAGIQIKVISGDNPVTVAALARQAGLPEDAKIISGIELNAGEPGQLADIAEATTIFGRITPQQKEAIVRALRARGRYVAMIGDGVNDVLSLKQANLGIAMQSGSQATRSVADIVLLGDSFASLPPAFREGQRILNGMQDILRLFLTRVLYVALLLISTGVIGGFPYEPKHGSLLTLFTVGIPTFALAAWAAPGLDVRHKLIRSLLGFVVPAGISISLVGLAVFLSYLLITIDTLERSTLLPADLSKLETALTVAQSALTTISVYCGLILIVFAKPPTRGWVAAVDLCPDWRPTYLAIGLLIGFLAVVAIPPVRAFFELAPLGIHDYLLLGGIAAAWAIVMRWVWRARLIDRFFNLDFSLLSRQ